ncbi:MAG: response regulator [Nitrospinaceae bacterium]
MTSKEKSIKEKRILIVEDCEDQALLLQNFLSNWGYRVQLSPNGKDALQLLEKYKPDLIISDIMMPEMDGFELCRAVKEDPSLSDLPVILITASWEKKDFFQGLDSGADYYFTKPCDKDYLKSKLDEILSGDGQEIPNDGMNGSSMDRVNGSMPMSRGKILNLLHSFYDISIQQNHKIMECQRELKSLRDQLKKKAS